MDPDELLVFVAGLVTVGVASVRWFDRLFSAGPPYSAASPSVRLALGLLPIALLIALAWVIQTGAARDVREDATYSWLFLALGGVWLALTCRAMAWLGIDASHDALERGNSAACVAICGALAGSTVIYAFANVGEGPTIWTTIGPALLGSAAGIGLMATFQAISGAADAITIDRDLASGIRFAGLAISGGSILGRPLAGDYVSAADTLGDFFGQAWPALPLVGVATWLEHRFRPSSRQPHPSPLWRGVLPSLGYLALGLLNLIHLGLPIARATQ